MFKLALLAMVLPVYISIYDFKVPSLDGKEINFSDFRGKKILVVNTASQCGFTPQYEELQELHEKYQSKLVVIGFPANNFGGQEPGSNEEIKDFCKKNFGVTFLMAEKVSVKGDDIHPIFKYLTQEAERKGIKDPIGWNFTKFLLDEKGNLIDVFPSKVKPMSDKIVSHLK